MVWVPAGQSTFEPGTEYEIPGTPGDPISIPCRFHLGGVKEFSNEDNKVVRQKGTIRCDAGVQLPDPGQLVKVVDGAIVHFEGRIMDVFRGQLSHRLDV